MLSHNLKDSIIVYHSTRKSGFVYKFFHTKGDEYRCCRCKELGKYRAVRVVNDVVVGRKSPQDDHHLDCEPKAESAVAALEVDREMRRDVRRNGKRPRDAFNEMLGGVAKRFKTSDTQTAVIAALPSYNDVRVQLSRSRSIRCIPVPHPLSLPEALQVTLRGREVDKEDEVHGERFLLYSGQGGRLLVFCANTELAVLHDSEYVVCDGTFEMSPDTAYQLYTIHGYKNGEGLPLVFTLLPNKTAVTYKELFDAICSALLSSYGDIGAMKFILMDFERAAMNAINAVFPDVRVKGCSFHFRQALMRRVQQEGLKSVYEENSHYPSARTWLRMVMAMSMLPAFAVPLVWNELKNTCTTGNAVLDAKLQAFAQYFDSTWIAGDFNPELWTHFDHTGPRTTILAEGFHNSLNSIGSARLIRPCELS